MVRNCSSTCPFLLDTDFQDFSSSRPSNCKAENIFAQTIKLQRRWSWSVQRLQPPLPDHSARDFCSLKSTVGNYYFFGHYCQHQFSLITISNLGSISAEGPSTANAVFSTWQLDFFLAGLDDRMLKTSMTANRLHSSSSLLGRLNQERRNLFSVQIWEVNTDHASHVMSVSPLSTQAGQSHWLNS